MKVGIDAGGTLIKIVQEQDNQRTFKTELTKNIDQVVELSLIHISEPTRHAQISYAVFCLKKFQFKKLKNSNE
ncbi:hypothetical protein JMUB7527_28650 [Staphylococcus aureus]